MNNIAVELIKKHEGFRAEVYHCTAGHRTVGYGYNLDANPLKLSDTELANIAKAGVDKSLGLILLCDLLQYQIEPKLVKALSWFTKLSVERQAVLLDMAYNLGVEGLLKFHNTLMFLERRDYNKAASNMLASAWARQVKGRALTLSEIMRTGEVK